MSEPRPAPARPSTWRLFRAFVARRLAPHWRWFALGAVLSAVVAAATSSYAVLVKFAIDALAGGSPAGLLLPLAILFAAAVKALALYGQTLANNTGVQRGLVALQDALFGRLIEADVARIEAEASGGFVSRFLNDMNVVREASLRLANNLIKSALTVIGCVAVMLWLDWALALVLLVVYPIAFAPVIRIGQKLRKTSLAAQEQSGDVAALLSESFQGARTVKAYGLEDWSKARAHTGFVERARLYLKVLTGKAAVDPILEIVGGAAFAGVLAFAGWRIAQGQATVGDFTAFIAALAAMAPEVRALGTLNAVVEEAAAALDRVDAVEAARADVAEPPDAAPLDRARGEIDVRGVSFAYPGRDSALVDVSFTARPGELVALVGPSGAGKSTLLALFLRFFDPESGTITLDRRDLRALRLADLRRSVAYVAQDAFAFDASLADNIALGRPGASRAEIEAAARAASAHDFILSTPGGYDTRAGEGGKALSGGQRQRIALARAILKDAPVLLLDEATSALDADTEAAVQSALDRFREGRTTLVVAHRLATVQAADRILVFDRGRIVETGDHASLSAAGGLYARLAERQLLS